MGISEERYPRTTRNRPIRTGPAPALERQGQNSRGSLRVPITGPANPTAGAFTALGISTALGHFGQTLEAHSTRDPVAGSAGMQPLRLKHQPGDNHLPLLASCSITVLRIRQLAAPADDRAHLR